MFWTIVRILNEKKIVKNRVIFRIKENKKDHLVTFVDVVFEYFE